MSTSNWSETDHPWLAKLDRAQVHINAAERIVATYTEREPYRVEYRASGDPHCQFVAFVLDEPPPVELSAVIGDALHNTRSALEAVSYFLARRDRGSEWADDDEARTTFPICETPKQFEEFFTDRGRTGLYSLESQNSLRTAQSFYYVEMMPSLYVDADERAQKIKEEHEWDTIVLLDRLWNIDKHRRLIRPDWTYDIAYWGSSGDGESRRRLGPRLPGDPVDVRFRQYDPPSDVIDHDVQWEFQLAIDDPHARERGVVEWLRGCHRQVVVTLHRILGPAGMTPNGS